MFLVLEETICAYIVLMSDTMALNDIICLPKFTNVQPYIEAGYTIIDTTSRSENPLFRQLSPFMLHSVQYPRVNIENLWQYSKMYEKHHKMSNKELGSLVVSFLGETIQLEEINPCKEFIEWANNGMKQARAVRYPMSKGAKPVCSIIRIDGKYYILDYISARKLIYIPQYARAVVKTEAFKELQRLRDEGKKLALLDFDGYDRKTHSYDDVINDATRKMGHSFVIAMLLDGYVPHDISCVIKRVLND